LTFRILIDCQLLTWRFHGTTRFHLQVLQPSLVGFVPTLFFGFDAIGAGSYGHVEISVDKTFENTTMKAGRCDGALSPSGVQ
jgi:hypothetical protein